MRCKGAPYGVTGSFRIEYVCCVRNWEMHDFRIRLPSPHWKQDHVTT